MNLQEARKRLPELEGLSDSDAIDVIQQVYYPQIERPKLEKALGYTAPPPPTPERSTLRAAGDLGLQFAGGAVSGVRMMTDLLGANNAASGGLRSAEDALQALQSATAKADQQQIAAIMKEAEGKGFADQVIAGVRAFGTAPAAMVAQAIGTSLPTLATALIPGAGAGAVAARLGMAGMIGAGQGAGAIKGAIYDEVKSAPLPGETPEQTEARAMQAQAYTGPNADQIALGGGLGALAGSTGIERAAGALRNGVTRAAPGMLGRVGMGALTEAAPEALQGGQEKFATNTALAREGMDVDPWAGVVAGGTMEALAGGLTGGVFGIPNPGVQEQRNPVKEAGDAVRAAKVPESGPMTKAVNAGTEMVAKQAEADVAAQVAAITPAPSPMLPTPTTLTGTDAAALMQPPENPLLGAAQEMQADRQSQARTDDALARMERQAARDQNALRDFSSGSTFDDMPATQATDVLNPSGQPFKTKMAAERAAKKTPGDVVAVPGGFVVRPKAQENLFDAPQATPDAAAGPQADPAAAPAVGGIAPGVPADTAAGEGSATPAVRGEQPEPQGALKLPRDLAGAKPRYSYGPKAFNLEFESDVDRAAYVIAQANTSSRDADYLKFVMDSTGMDEAAARAYGRQVKDAIKARAKDADAGTLPLPDQRAGIRNMQTANAPAQQPQGQAGEWQTFPPETGSLNLPRAEMPQVKAEHRGPMVNFLNARGIEHEADEVDPAELKPTQAEYSLEKVKRAQEFGGTDRSILISSDGYVVDGHHQWLAKGNKGEPVKVIRLKAPIKDLLPLVREFPSSTVDTATADVQNQAPAAPAQPEEAQATRVEAPAPAGGDGAAEGGVSDARGTGDAQADGVMDPEDAKDMADHEAARQRFNERAPRIKAARERGDTAEVERLNEESRKDDVIMRATMARVTKRGLARSSAEVTKADAKKFADMLVGTRMRPSEFSNGNIFWEKVGQDEWRGTGAMLDGKTTTNQGLAERGGLVEMKPEAKPEAQQAQTPTTKEEGNTAREKALQRIEKGTAYFGTTEKAQAFIDKFGLGDTHEAVQTKPGRFEVQAKKAEQKPTKFVPSSKAMEAWNSAVEFNNMGDYRALNSPGAKASYRLGFLMGYDGAPIPSYEGNERDRAGWLRMVDGHREGSRYESSYVKPPAPAPEPSPLVKAMNDLAEVRAKIADQGQVVDDRLLQRERQLKAMVKELEGEQKPAAPAPAAEVSTPEQQSNVEFIKALEEARKELPDGFTLQAERDSVALKEGGRYAVTGLGRNAAGVAEALRQAKLRAQANAATAASAAPAAAPAPASAPAVSANTIFTEDAAAKARALLKKKLSGSTLNSGIDPELLQAGITLAGYHIERGARTFAAYASAMLADLGDGVKPYLKSWYMAVAFDPRASGFAADMTPVSEVAGIDVDSPTPVDNMAAPADTQEQEDGNQDEPAGRPEQSNDPAGNGADDAEPLDPQLPAGNPELAQDVAPDASASLRGTDADGNGRADRGRVATRTGVGRGKKPVLSGSPAEVRPVSRTPVGPQPDAGNQLFGEAPGNYEITDQDAIGEGTAGQKLRANMEAIRTLRRVQKENRNATPAEQATMAKFVGWGGLRALIDPNATGKQWLDARAELLGTNGQTPLLVNGDKGSEWIALQRSTTAAHYTAPEIVKSMWDVVRHFGFNGGRVLEPTSGIGNFIGLQPRDLAASSEWHGAELDIITGQMAKLIYPEASIAAGIGFQDVPFAKGAFDLAIGNPPFGSLTIKSSIPAYKDLPEMKLHNFIIAKTGEHLRPGGVMAMVVTHRFLDTANPEAREHLAKGFKFLGAFRLPNDAFLKNAGTEVTTDVVFLQKLHVGEKATDQSWLDTEGKIVVDGSEMRVNRYYEQNPGNILGRSAMDGTMYAGRRGEGGEYTVHSDGRDLKQAIANLLQNQWADLKDVAKPTANDSAVAAVMIEQSDLPVGGVMLDESGKLLRREMDDEAGNAVIVEITPQTIWKDGGDKWKTLADAAAALKSAKDVAVAADDLRAAASVAYNAKGEKKTSPIKAEQAVYEIVDAAVAPGFRWQYDTQLATINAALERKKLGDDGYQAIKGMVGLRNTTLRLIEAERADDIATMNALRAQLNAEYDAFVAKHGYISDPQNSNLLDGDVGVESGLEAAYKPRNGKVKSSARKADIFTKRVNYPYREVTSAKDAADGLQVSLSERGRLDIPYIAKLTGKSSMEVISDLSTGDNPLIFLDPDTQEYTDADAYLSGNVKAKLQKAKAAGLKANVRALEAVQPPPKTKDNVRPSIRGAWMPEKVFQDFLTDLGARNPRVSIIPSQGMIIGSAANVQETEFGSQFKNSNKSIIELFNAATSGKPINIFREDSNGNRVKNEVATKEVNLLVERMAKVFNEWAWSNDDRIQSVVDAFNEKMNTHVPRKFDGRKYLKTVGASPSIELRTTQKNAAWRIVQAQTVLLDHVVGAGKTFTVITGAMQRRRLGLSRKPMIVVPNHLVTQWAKDFYALYPGAKILAATPDDFAAKKRRRLFSRIATGDFDAVIIGHSSLSFIDTPEADQEMVINEQIKELQDVLNELKAKNESGRTLTQIQEKLQKYEGKLKELREMRRDEIGLDLEKMGVDYLAIDEMHEFKNLEYSTAGERVVGMNDPKGSKKAFDLYLKIRGVIARGGAVTGATGTPVSNSLVELYTMMKYLAHKDLVERDQLNFDAWSGAYARTETKLEYTATQKLKPRRVLAGLNNLSALKQLYEQFGDVISMADLKRMHAEDVRRKNAQEGTKLTEQFPVPKVKGGARVLESGPITAQQSSYMDYLVARMQAIEANKRNKEYARIDNPLYVLTDARKMSLDIRIVDPTAPRDENGKVMRAAAKVLATYQKWDKYRGTQMVFCDLSTPAKNAVKEARSLIRESIEKLFGTGADAKRIAARVKSMPTFTEQWRFIESMAAEVAESPNTDPEVANKMEAYLGALEDVDATMTTADVGFSVYDDMKKVLVERGIPEAEIAFIHDYNTPEQKAKLFAEVNDGTIRVLLGSSAKMGAGTNAQKRLVALHHMDAPWRPSDVEQREGRIIRQGNGLYAAIHDYGLEKDVPADLLAKAADLKRENPNGFEVEITAYSTAGTSDAVMWQVLERKARAIEEFRSAGLDATEEEGSDSNQYAEFMAQSTGNPVFRLKLEAEREVDVLDTESRGALLAKGQSQRFLETYDDNLRDAKAAIAYGKAADFSEVKVGSQGGTAAEFAQVMDATRQKHDKAYAEYLTKKEAADAELAAWNELTELERGEKPKMPTAPSMPGILSKTFQEASGYARAIKAALEAGTNSGEIGHTFNLGTMRFRVRKSKFSEDLWHLDAWNGFTFESLTHGEGKTAESSGKLANALTPDALRDLAAEFVSVGTSREKSLTDQFEIKSKLAAKSIDTAKLNEARKVMEWYRTQVAFAEQQADIRRSERPNRYIQNDRKRELTQAKVELGDTSPIEFEGEVFRPTGFRDGYMLQATGKDGREVLLSTKLDKNGVRSVEQVIEKPKGVEFSGLMQATPPADVMFSRGAGQGITKKAATEVVDAIRSRWTNGPEVVVVATMQDPAVPRAVREADIQQRSQGATGEPEGFWYGGKAYVVAGALNGPADVVRVLFHETLGHYGLRGVFGEGLTPILKQLAALRRKEVQAKAKQYGLDVTNEQQRLQAAEEVLAEMAQSRPEIGFVQRAIAAVRAWLRKTVPLFKSMELTDAEIIQQYILPARRFVEQGARAQAKGQTAVAFSQGSESALAELARADELFAVPKSDKATFEEIMAELAPGAEVKKITNIPGRVQFNITMPDGNTARVMQRPYNPYGETVYGFDLDEDGEMMNMQVGRPGENPDDVGAVDDVWIDVSLLEPGSKFGEIIYSAVANYAHNTGRIFIGDPAGLSDEALRRRTEQMISSALKFGTTEHIAPHPRQTAGSEKLGVPALKWVYGDHVGNIERMIDVSLRSLENAGLDLSKVGYDPQRESFIDTSTGNPLQRGPQLVTLANAPVVGGGGRERRASGGVVRSGRNGAGQAGWRTVARASLLSHLKSTISVEPGNSQRGGLLDRLRDVSAGLARDSATGRVAEKEERIFYSRSAAGLTDTPEFRRWFGDSKVVDAQGEPLVVYHGTDFPRAIEAFKMRQEKAGVRAAYFTPDPAVASAYATRMGTTDYNTAPNVLPVYLALKNPLEVDGEGRGWGFVNDRALEAAKKGKHDGIIIRNVIDAASRETAYPSTVYIAFRPEQIKSAIGNNGDFDPANPDIRFSRAQAGSPDDTRAKLLDTIPAGVMERLEDLTSSQRGFNRWWHRTVGTQLHKAKTNKEFGRVFYAVQDFMKDTSRMATIAADLAPDLLPQVDSLKDVKKLLPQMVNTKARRADLKAASDALFDGTLRYTRNEAGEAVEVEPSSEEPGGLVWSDAELRARGLNDKAIAMYKQARAAINQSMDNLLAADVYRMMTAMKPEMLADDPGALASLMDKVRRAAASDEPLSAVSLALRALNAQGAQTLAQIRRLRAQVESEKGSSTPTAFLATSALKRATDLMNQIEQARESMQAKIDRIAELQARGYAPLMRFGPYTVDVVDPDGTRVFFGMYETQFAANRAARRFREQGLVVSQGVKSQREFELLKGVSPETAMLFADMLGIEKNDVMQAWLQNALAEQSALKRHIRRKGIDGFDDDSSRVVAAFLTSNSRAGARALHGLRIKEFVENVREGDVKDEAIALAQYVDNPREEAQAVRSLLFVNYIGGSIASAMVNLTQTLVQTFPYLAQFGGATGAARRLGAAMKLAMGKIEDPDLAAAVARAERDGVIKPQEVFQLQAEASRSLGSDLRVRAGLAIWGSFFQAAEVFNRRVAFIAAYQTAKERKIPSPFAFAENAVDETQGVFNKGNRPNWARGAVGATLFTFKTFTIQYVEFLKRLPPKEKALALAVLVVLSGVRGIPFAEDAEDIIDTVAQHLGYSFTTKDAMHRFAANTLGKDFADFLMSGASGTGLIPFDVSARLGMGDLLPATGLLKPSETRKEDQVLEAFGVAGGFVRDALKGEVRPVAIRNLAKGIEMYDRGIYTDGRGRKVMDVTAGDAALKAIGLQPAKVASESRAVSTQYEQRTLFTKVKGEINEQIALGMFEGDQDKVRRARERLADWNEKNPDAKIVLSGQSIRRRVAEMRKDRTERFVNSTPRELRQQTREALTD